jgi:hypothetical protein
VRRAQVGAGARAEPAPQHSVLQSEANTEEAGPSVSSICRVAC